MPLKYTCFKRGLKGDIFELFVVRSLLSTQVFGQSHIFGQILQLKSGISELIVIRAERFSELLTNIGER